MEHIVTGYNQYALEAFRVNALDYLLKPVSLNSIQKCILRLLKLKGTGHQQKSVENSQRIYCFGDCEVYGNNGLVKWTTRKVEEMLAYFIVHRDSNIESWQLGEVLWPEEEPDKVRSNLHTTLYRLRKTIKEEGLPLEISTGKGGKGTYRCSLGPLFCDLTEFEEMVRDDVTLKMLTITNDLTLNETVQTFQVNPELAIHARVVSGNSDGKTAIYIHGGGSGGNHTMLFKTREMDV